MVRLHSHHVGELRVVQSGDERRNNFADVTSSSHRDLLLRVTTLRHQPVAVHAVVANNLVAKPVGGVEQAGKHVDHFDAQGADRFGVVGLHQQKPGQNLLRPGDIDSKLRRDVELGLHLLQHCFNAGVHLREGRIEPHDSVDPIKSSDHLGHLVVVGNIRNHVLDAIVTLFGFLARHHRNQAHFGFKGGQGKRVDKGLGKQAVGTEDSNGGSH